MTDRRLTVTFPIDVAQFKAATGREPSADDLERCNCPDAGNFGHWSCGWDSLRNLPKFMTGPTFATAPHSSYTTERGRAIDALREFLHIDRDVAEMAVDLALNAQSRMPKAVRPPFELVTQESADRHAAEHRASLQLDIKIAAESAKFIDWFKRNGPDALPIPGAAYDDEIHASEPMLQTVWNQGYLTALQDLIPLAMGLHSPQFGKRNP